MSAAYIIRRQWHERNEVDKLKTNNGEQHFPYNVSGSRMGRDIDQTFPVESASD